MPRIRIIRFNGGIRESRIKTQFISESSVKLAIFDGNCKMSVVIHVCLVLIIAGLLLDLNCEIFRTAYLPCEENEISILECSIYS